MAIRHREVFPEGSSPDSIDWRVWNDDHVGDGGGGDSGIIVSDSDPGAGNDFWLDTSGLQPVLKIRNAADDGWLVSGGNVRYLKKRVTFSDFVASGFNGWIPGFYTVPAGSVITYLGIRIVEGFDDSTLTALDVNSVTALGVAIGNIVAQESASITQATVAPFDDIGGGAPSFPGGTTPDVSGLYAITDVLISPMMMSWADDGSTGIADIYFRIETPVAP